MTDAAERAEANDYDLFEPSFLVDPYPHLAELRERCPVAHSRRLGGSWMPTRYEDVVATARDHEHFSSRSAAIAPPAASQQALLPSGLPPIEADPPRHTASRRMILPWFSNAKVAGYEAFTRDTCRRLLAALDGRERVDAAQEYARQIPVRVIGEMLGIPEAMADTFTGWVADALSSPPGDPRRDPAIEAMIGYFIGVIDERRDGDGDDLISEVLAGTGEGMDAPVTPEEALGMVALLLVAGVDTTWSAIGASIWHLATHPDDRRRLLEDPGIWPTAIEELLRFYSPVTMARLAGEGAEIAGCPIPEGDRVLLHFGAANHDPTAFPDADRVVLDRDVNRHVAFGAGIHRCAGSNLARMELRVALEEWLAVFPEFALTPGAEVTWSGGQVRGPRTVPLTIG